MVQRRLHRAAQDEGKPGILELLNLEDHVLFAPSRLRDREGIFLYRHERLSLQQQICPRTPCVLGIPETHILVK
jgi:hypothetical protein